MISGSEYFPCGKWLNFSFENLSNHQRECEGELETGASYFFKCAKYIDKLWIATGKEGNWANL